MSGESDTSSFYDEDFGTAEVENGDRETLGLSKIRSSEQITLEVENEPFPHPHEEFGEQWVYEFEVVDVDGNIPLGDGKAEVGDHCVAFVGAKSFNNVMQEIGEENDRSLEGVEVRVSKESNDKYATYEVEAV